MSLPPNVRADGEAQFALSGDWTIEQAGALSLAAKQLLDEGPTGWQRKARPRPDRRHGYGRGAADQPRPRRTDQCGRQGRFIRGQRCPCGAARRYALRSSAAAAAPRAVPFPSTGGRRPKRRTRRQGLCHRNRLSWQDCGDLWRIDRAARPLAADVHRLSPGEVFLAKRPDRHDDHVPGRLHRLAAGYLPARAIWHAAIRRRPDRRAGAARAWRPAHRDHGRGTVSAPR